MNNVIITGRLTRDPEIKAVGDTHVSTIIVAVEDRGKGDSKVSFIPVTCWGAVATAVAKYLSKGSHILVRGKLIQKVYKNTEGKTVSRIEITADTIEFLSRPHKSEEVPTVEEEITEDLPF